MPRVMQIRGVPDAVHRELSEAAAAEGVSLTRYLQRELEQLARRARVVRDNATAVRETQAAVGGAVDRNTILATLDEARGD